MVCKNLKEVRNNIDRIDNEIVKLIAERGVYVREASKFKKSNYDVKAPDRVELVIKKVRDLSKNYNINPDMIEFIYREMINKFISMEIDEFNKIK